MTIDELLATAGLTGNDEIPIWDAEATGEPTKKITAQNFASAVVALANLVTGVKGDAEQNYRHGDVNLTPANIGAVSTSAVIDIPHGGTGAADAPGARANLGALGSFATYVSFGGSATNFYQNLGAQINTMSDWESRIFVSTADVASEPFLISHTYSGTIVRYNSTTCGGILTNQIGTSIAIGCNNGTWYANLL